MTEEDLFLAAIDMPHGEARAQYLSEACGADSRLRQQVEALLSSHFKSGEFLDVPAAEQIEQARVGKETIDMSLDSMNTDAKPDDGSSVLQLLAPTTHPDSLGRIGHYEVLQVLGKGAFGTVLRAHDNVLQRVVAIKVLAPEMAATSPARKRFLREARSSAKIRHENVVQVYEVGEQPLPHLIMEFIPGETLQQRMDRVGPLEVPEILQIGRQIAEALAAAHANDLIHRDIKPGNVLLEGGQHKVKITDFGLARAADDASMTQSGIIAGTPMFMAPEQVHGKMLDQRADLFSLGSVMYQMVTGRPPFRANTTVAVLKRVAYDTPRSIHEIIPETPQWLCDIITKLHAKDRDQRYQTAREVADVLADCEEQLKQNSRLRDFSRIPRSDQPAAPPWWKSSLAAALVLGILAASSFGLYLNNLPKPAGKPSQANNVDTKLRSDQRAEISRKPAPPATPSKIAPFTDAEVERIAALPALEQIKAVRKELMRRNPKFDGEMEPGYQDGQVTSLEIGSDKVSDIAPVRALKHLKKFVFNGASKGDGMLQDLSPLKGLPLTWLNIDNNPVTDLSPLAGMQLEYLHAWQWQGSDITPLKNMPLKRLNLGGGGKAIDLSPLAGAPLEYACFNYSRVSSLAALKDSPLTAVEIEFTQVADLEPLRNKRLTSLYISGSKVSNLSPLESMPLREFKFAETLVTDLAPLAKLPLTTVECDVKTAQSSNVLREIKTLEKINGQPPTVFWKGTDFDIERVAALVALEQLPAVEAEFKRLNPGFVGRFNHQLEQDQVARFAVEGNVIREVSPIKAFKHVRDVTFVGGNPNLTQLQGLNLTGLGLYHTQVTDLSPLKGMKLTAIDLSGSTLITDLSPLSELPLTGLTTFGTQVADLSPLAKLKINHLNCSVSPVSNLSALTEMPLDILNLEGCPVSDLSPLEKTPLRVLYMRKTLVTDLTPLKNLPLKFIGLDFEAARDATILREIKTLEMINDKPVEQFWKEVDGK